MSQAGSTGVFRIGQLLMRFGVRMMSMSGAPTNGSSGTGATLAAPGSQVLDYTNGVKYMNIGTKAAPVWTPLSPVTISVSSANILAMNGAAVNLVAAPAAGYCIFVDNIVIIMTRTSTQYASGGVVTIQYTGAASVHTSTLPASVITGAAGTVITQLGPATAANGTTVPTATGLEITNATGAFTTGTGTMKVVLDYRIVKQ